MPEDCCCEGGRCGPPNHSELSRREFLQTVAVGTAGLVAGAELSGSEKAAGENAPRLSTPKLSEMERYPITSPRVYEGKHLEAVAMPIGGLGTGTVWLDGQGRLAVWQIFNNLGEPRIPDSFFAVRVRARGSEPVIRVLQTVAEGPLEPVKSLTFEGGYPIARLTFNDPELPVEILMEAFNPMIPTDAASSSIPCAIFRLTARNTSRVPVEVAFVAALQNAVGSRGAGNLQGVRFGGYGGNRNRIVREKGMTAVVMDKVPDPVVTGPVRVRAQTGEEVAGPELYWLTDVPGLTPQVVDPLARIADKGGVALASGAQVGFFRNIADLRKHVGDLSSLATVFEDFEKDTYEGWTITGEAFGQGPSHGTSPGQQPVSGFVGHGLVNTFAPNDAPQGTATSKPFRIEKRYIGFLIGGGNHPNETCINLRVDNKVVRTATGKNQEALEPASWDVSDLKGKEAVIEIVDHQSGGWGHINIDQIIFSDIPPEALLRQGTPAEAVAKAIDLPFTTAEEATLPAESKISLTSKAPGDLGTVLDIWKVRHYTRLRGFRSSDRGYRVLAVTQEGDPLIIEGPLGKGRVIFALAPGLPWSWGASLLIAARGASLRDGERLAPGDAGWGSMALASLESKAAGLAAWSRDKDIISFISDSSSTSVSADAVSTDGETINGALSVPMTLKSGEERTATFVITWHFPNVQRFQHAGNLYSRRWADAAAVARYVAANAKSLWERTRLYHATIYQSNLPEEFLDAMTSQSVIFRGPTCFWSEDGYFGGYEGSYGCCPLNCTHVWNYAQSHARLFPEVGRNMRVSDFITFLHPNGETSHRQHEPCNAFVDGHCACIEAAYREYQLSPDRSFLQKIWPGVKKAVDWLIEAFDKDHDGVTSGHQWNTYDTAVSGANTFIGSQYLSALAAAERLAMALEEQESANRWRVVREAGMKNQNEKLWNGEYYLQIPGTPPASDYGNGCHADQLLGQWWAHTLDIGYLYPAERVRGALDAVMRHNFREKFAGIKQEPRRYIPDDEGGLLICTWPHNDRPNPFILYADEVWTGIEYAVAGAMVYEGLVDHARRIVKMARSRYDGRRRDGLNSGPGGNPYNELECGKFYARAMSSWSLLIASQGLILEGPKGILGFKPRWQPEDHRSFFTAPEGWGLFVQKRESNRQSERIEVRHGRLRLRELVFEIPKDVGLLKTTVHIGDRSVKLTPKRNDGEVRLVLGREVTIAEGKVVVAGLEW